MDTPYAPPEYKVRAGSSSNRNGLSILNPLIVAIGLRAAKYSSSSSLSSFSCPVGSMRHPPGPIPNSTADRAWMRETLRSCGTASASQVPVCRQSGTLTSHRHSFQFAVNRDFTITSSQADAALRRPISCLASLNRDCVGRRVCHTICCSGNHN